MYGSSVTLDLSALVSGLVVKIDRKLVRTNLLLHKLRHTLTITYHYSGNFRGRKFLRMVNYRVFAKNIICECLVYVDKDRAIEMIHKKILSAKCSISWIHEKFIP